MPNKDIAEFLRKADLFVNMSHTGSLDKAMLEAMACGLPVLTCNEALENILGRYKRLLMYPKDDYKMLASKVRLINKMSIEDKEKIRRELRDIVALNHGQGNLIKKIVLSFDN